MSQCKTKADWKVKLTNAGIQVPQDATLQYMKMVWAETQQGKQVKNLEGSLEHEIKALRAAGRKKSVLVDFLKEKGMEINPNSTISQLLAMGEKEIHDQFEPMETEKMNFGKYADLTFGEVFNMHPSYVEWIKTTAQESDSMHWRLLRFHRWIMQAKATQKISKKGYTMSPESVGSFSVISEQEAPTAAAKDLMEAWNQINEQRQLLEARALELEKQQTELNLENLVTKDRKTRREM